MPQRPRMLILADDLSGAADCGVACARAGLPTLVLLDAGAAGDAAEALAVDLDSRSLDAAAARAVVRKAADHRLRPGSLLYAKIDSTLRGNPGAEIAAARAALAACLPARHGSLAVVAPAFPAMGRTVRDGRVLVRGVPLAQTETWRRERGDADPHLAAALEAAGLRTRAASLETVRGGGLAAAMQRARAEGAGAVVCDAESESDLAAIATAGTDLGPGIVWAGSAGLARHLAGRVASGAGPASRTAPPAHRRGGPVLVVIGSMSTLARAQCQAIADQARRIAVPSEALLAGPTAAGWVAAEAALRRAVAAAPAIVLSVEADGGGMPPTRSVSAALARLVAPELHRIGALVASGGDTARAVLTVAGVARLCLLGEIEPGVPLSVTAGLPGTPLPVVTKAGAFGDERTLIRCVEALRALPEARDATASAAGRQENEA
ncbi:MAG: four-carbon acid sugar kinase family protein [Alphaproteobacteria bacterium]|nr:four-carbon acid sugar kinase family protein [Alphaproteobacteria bacterium]